MSHIGAGKPIGEIEMMTDDERKLVDEVEETTPDFYAPLMALCLRRFSRRASDEGILLKDSAIKEIVLGAYADLEERG